MSRKCPFTGCGRTIDSTKFACVTHWYRLDRSQQARIYAAYNGWLRGSVSGDELREEQELVIREVEGRVQP